MQCKYCHAPMSENTTVCMNCGKSSAKKNGDCCPECGSALKVRPVDKIRPKPIDWFVIIAFFPLGLLYIPALKNIRTYREYRCYHCGYVYKTERILTLT